MILTFDKAAVLRLLEHAAAATKHSPTLAQIYDPKYRKDGLEPGFSGGVTADDVDPAKLSAGLYLVGDNGVYLMSNGDPGLLKPEGGNVVVFANECNPETMDFDDWWGAKQASFGGDDGVELIEAHDATNWIDETKGDVVRLDISDERFELLLGR